MFFLLKDFIRRRWMLSLVVTLVVVAVFLKANQVAPQQQPTKMRIFKMAFFLSTISMFAMMTENGDMKIRQC